MIISNKTSKVKFFNTKTKDLFDSPYEFLNIDIIRTSNLLAHEKNINNFFLRPDKYNEVFNDIYLIPPRSSWKYITNTFSLQNNLNISSNYYNNDIIKVCERLLKVLDKKNIGIELSGGLDTAIIIGILKCFRQDNLFLVGSRSDRYELRTETYIQDIISKDFKNVCFIDENSSLPFTDLKSTPLHPYPSSTSIFYRHARNIAKQCKINNIDILLNGMGMDLLFCDDLKKTNKNKLPWNWLNWMLDDNWFNENIYKPMNISYKSGAYSSNIIKTLFALRKEQSEDPQKLWARNFFKQYIPNELEDFYYKADNSGGFLDGFLNAKKEIKDLFKLAYEVTRFTEFNDNSFNQLYKKSHLIDEGKTKIILSRVSYANWIYGLIREKII